MNATDTRGVESDVLVIVAGPTRLVVDVVDAKSALGHSTFDDVLALFTDEIYRYAVHLTRNHGEADNLYQRTLLEAYYAFDRLDETTNYRTWGLAAGDRVRPPPAVRGGIAGQGRTVHRGGSAARARATRRERSCRTRGHIRVRRRVTRRTPGWTTGQDARA